LRLGRNGVYSVYRERAHAFEPALALTLPEVKRLGMVTFDDPEATLWRPYGSRRILHVCSGDDANWLRANGIEYVWINTHAFQRLFNGPLGGWLQRVNGRRLQTIQLNLRAGQEAIPWILVNRLIQINRFFSLNEPFRILPVNESS
jgi:hypothetical protein